MDNWDHQSTSTAFENVEEDAPAEFDAPPSPALSIAASSVTVFSLGPNRVFTIASLSYVHRAVSQPLVDRHPWELDTAHAIPIALAGTLPISRRAFGLACVSTETHHWYFARRVGRFHVAHRDFITPQQIVARARCEHWISEARLRVGAGAKVYYIRWDMAQYGGDGIGLINLASSDWPRANP
jgi:hypothetical protein